MNNPNFNEILSEALAKYNRKTNAGRIRSMSDMELAAIIKCPMTSPCSHLEDDFPCVYCKLKWLKEEVSE